MRRAIVIVTALFVLSGCSTMSYSQRYDPGAGFTEYRTFAFLPLPEKKKEDTVLLLKNLRHAVNGTLQAKGFTQDANKPDFLVALHAVTEKRVDVEQYGYAYSTGFNDDPYYYHGDRRYPRHGRGYYGPDSYEYRSGYDVYEYRLGTLVVDIVDRGTNELVWRGLAEGPLPDNITEQFMRTTSNGILREFPPGTVKR